MSEPRIPRHKHPGTRRALAAYALAALGGVVLWIAVAAWLG